MAVATPLATIEQSSWGAGEFQGVPPQFVPPNGVIALRNGLLDAEEGIAYRRGGVGYWSNNGLAASLKFLWSGSTQGQPNLTVVSDGTSLAYVGANGTALTTLPSAPSGAMPSRPGHAALVRGVLYFPGGIIWAGSQKVNAYSTGTVAYSTATGLITGTGTAFMGVVDKGMLIQFGGTGSWYPVESANSNTSLALRYGPSADVPAGTSYELRPVASLPSYSNNIGGSFFIVASATARATIFGRLVLGAGDKIGFSHADDPQSFTATDLHVLPGGAQIGALVPLRGDMFVFTDRGVWKIDNMGYDLTDEYGNVQQSLTKVSDLRLLGNDDGQAGIVEWEGALIVPARDGIWIMDGVSAPRRIDMADEGRYAAWAALSRSPGGAAVSRGHYLLPIRSGSTVDMVLVYRLERPQQTPFGVAYPSSYFDGFGANILQYGVASPANALVGASGASTGRVINALYFSQGAGVKNDADGSSHTFQLDTRDYADQRVPQHFRRASLLYELTDATGTDNPSITASYSSDPTGSSWTSFSDTAGPSDGTGPKVWNMARKTRFLRFRFQSSGPTSNLKIRLLRLWVRPSGRDH